MGLVRKGVIDLTVLWLLQKMKSDMNSSSSRSQLLLSQRGALLGPSYEGPKRAMGRYAKMEQEMQRSNQDFINSELQEQQVGGTCWVGVEFCVA